jgi:chitinase
MNITVQPQQQPGCNIPRHILIGYWANFPNSGQFFPLRQVSSNYNIVNIAFGLPRSPTDPTIQFEAPTQFYPTNQDFANDVATLQGQGRKVVLSIGGAAGGAFELNTDAERNTFVNSVFNLITTFGFDGIDVDFEGGGPGNPLLRNANDNDFRNPTTPRIRNAILALREIRNRFVSAFPNRCFILSFAPETFFLQAGFQFYASSVPTTLGCYIPVIDALRDITSWVHTQDYNTGTMLALDQNVYGSGNADFHVAMTEMLLRGFQVGSRDPSPGPVFAPLSEGQVAFGLPASTAAAGSGFTSVQAVQNAVRYLTQRTEYAGRSYTLQKPTGAYLSFRGLMTWNVFHDAANGFEFSANHGPFLRSLP